MKVPLSWLRDFVDVELAPEELARRLTMAGVEVEGIEQIGADWDRDTILVGVVERVEPHPAADRLVLATVSAGERRLTVVTGAPNVAEGQKVALALTGAQLWDGHSETPKRMTLAGLRPINTVADVTNYVMLEWGQPLHAFDRDRLVGGRIVVRRARPGERLETLDHVVRTLDDRMLVIADAEKPVGLAGVMG